MAEEAIKEPEQNEKSDETKAIEAKARNLGWVPRDEYHGDPDQWKDAEEFVRHGEDTLPILRENLKRLHKKLDDQNKVIRDFAEHHKKVEERAYQRALKKLQDERKEAVGKGDIDEFEKIDKEIEDLKKIKPKKTTQSEKNPEFSDWASENDWYGEDIDMTIYADQIGSYLNATHSDWPLSRIYQEVAKRVKKKYPDYFSNKRKTVPAAVEAGNPGAGNIKSGGKGYTDLPTEAKKVCDEFVKQGLLTREQYVKEYFAGGEKG